MYFKNFSDTENLVFVISYESFVNYFIFRSKYIEKTNKFLHIAKIIPFKLQTFTKNNENLRANTFYIKKTPYTYKISCKFAAK